MKSLLGSLVLATALGCLAPAAFAVDGVVLIDQNRALAGNVTPGDAPGFPVTLSQRGSYRLSGNLTVPANVDGILIAADRVTLDLNGFTMAGGGSGRGIFNGGIGRLGTAIRNGTVANFFAGIDFAAVGGAGGQSTEIQQIRAIDNTRFGIAVNPNAIVSGCTAVGNGVGIGTGSDSVLTGNNASGNETGIDIGVRSLLSGNVASDNAAGAIGAGIGILVTCPSNLVGNAAIGNSTDVIELGVGCTRANNNPAP